MPIGPDYIKEVRTDLIADIIDAIDEKIKEDYCEGDLSIYAIIKDHHLTSVEIEEIIAAYIRVGWGGVEYKTSAEHGERPGLVRFTFHKKKDNTVSELEDALDEAITYKKLLRSQQQDLFNALTMISEYSSLTTTQIALRRVLEKRGIK